MYPSCTHLVHIGSLTVYISWCPWYPGLYLWITLLLHLTTWLCTTQYNAVPYTVLCLLAVNKWGNPHNEPDVDLAWLKNLLTQIGRGRWSSAHLSYKNQTLPDLGVRCEKWEKMFAECLCAWILSSTTAAAAELQSQLWVLCYVHQARMHMHVEKEGVKKCQLPMQRIIVNMHSIITIINSIKYKYA